MIFDTSPRAAREIERIERWWSKNRPAAPGLFMEELVAAEAHLMTAPETGEAWRARRGRVIRRWLLPKSKYHLYYVHDAERERLLVVAVWGAVRREPKL